MNLKFGIDFLNLRQNNSWRWFKMLNEYNLTLNQKVGCCQEKQLIQELTKSQRNVFANRDWNISTYNMCGEIKIICLK